MHMEGLGLPSTHAYDVLLHPPNEFGRLLLPSLRGWKGALGNCDNFAKGLNVLLLDPGLKFRFLRSKASAEHHRAPLRQEVLIKHFGYLASFSVDCR